jgi:bacteriocin-like protein
MSNQERKKESANISRQPDAEDKKNPELSEEELKKVSGGSADPQEGGQRPGRG